MDIKEDLNEALEQSNIKYHKTTILTVFLTITSGWFVFQAYEVLNISSEYLGYLNWKEALIKPIKLCFIYTVPILLAFVSQFFITKRLYKNLNKVKNNSILTTIKTLKILNFLFLVVNLLILGFYYLIYSDLFSFYTYNEYTPNEIQKIAIHESAHCIINENEFPNTTMEIRIFDKRDYEQVDKYIGRNLALQLPDGIHLSNQNNLYTKTHVSKLIKIDLAGIIAEELLSEDKVPTLGSKSDFDKVQELVIALVDNGQTYLGVTSWNLLTTNERKKVYEDIVNPLYIETKGDVLDNKEEILKLANILVKKRVLKGEEIQNVIYQH